MPALSVTPNAALVVGDDGKLRAYKQTVVRVTWDTQDPTPWRLVGFEVVIYQAAGSPNNPANIIGSASTKTTARVVDVPCTPLTTQTAKAAVRAVYQDGTTSEWATLIASIVVPAQAFLITTT